MSTRKSNAISLIAPILPHLKSEMIVEFVNTNLKAAAAKFLEKLSTYESKLNDDITLVAALLDPRINFTFLNQNRSEAGPLLRAHLSDIEENSTIDGPLESLSLDYSVNDLFHKIWQDNSSDEVDRYLSSGIEEASINVLDFWRANQKNYPKLHRLARIVFTAQATSVASEGVFSSAREIDTPKRNKLSDESFRANMLMRNWIPFLNIA